MAGNAYIVAAYNNEDDTTIDYTVQTDNQTLAVYGATVPNPAWVDDGIQTTPDINGEPRYLPQDLNALNNSQFLFDGVVTVEQARLQKAAFQELNPSLDIRLARVQVTATLA